MRRYQIYKQISNQLWKFRSAHQTHGDENPKAWLKMRPYPSMLRVQKMFLRLWEGNVWHDWCLESGFPGNPSEWIQTVQNSVLVALNLRLSSIKRCPAPNHAILRITVRFFVSKLTRKNKRKKGSGMANGWSRKRDSERRCLNNPPWMFYTIDWGYANQNGYSKGDFKHIQTSFGSVTCFVSLFTRSTDRPPRRSEDRRRMESCIRPTKKVWSRILRPPRLVKSSSRFQPGKCVRRQSCPSWRPLFIVHMLPPGSVSRPRLKKKLGKNEPKWRALQNLVLRSLLDRGVFHFGMVEWIIRIQSMKKEADVYSHFVKCGWSPFNHAARGHNWPNFSVLSIVTRWCGVILGVMGPEWILI